MSLIRAFSKFVWKDMVSILFLSASSWCTGRGGCQYCDIIVVKAVLAGFTSSSCIFPETQIVLHSGLVSPFFQLLSNASSISTHVDLVDYNLNY